MGDTRSYLVALITLSAEELQSCQRSEAFAGKTIHEIAASDPIEKRVRQAVESANAELARYERVRKYKVLDREFTVEDGEMTPTHKLKRKVTEQAHAAEFDALYNHP